MLCGYLFDIHSDAGAIIGAIALMQGIGKLEGKGVLSLHTGKKRMEGQVDP
jgi:hypothetical protein